MKIKYVIVFLILSTAPLFAGENATSQYIKQGFEQLKTGRYQKSIKTFEVATRIDPACAEAYEGIGEAYLGMGDNVVTSDQEMIERAINNLKFAIRLSPKMAVAHYKLATAYLALNDKEKAVGEYEILKGIDKDEASRLSKQISKYKAPNKYHFIGSSGTTQGSRTNYGARIGGNGTQPVTAKTKQESFTGTVELFVTSWCPVCKETINYLNKKGIPYIAHDIEADEQANRRFHELGGHGVPLVVIGKNKISGFSPELIDYYTGK